MLRLQDVSRRYRSGKVYIEALRAVNFEVVPGDFAVVKGPSGSGKSTLLNILGLLDAPNEGAVYLDGQAVRYDDFDALAITRARLISFIFQSFNLNPVLTLEENVIQGQEIEIIVEQDKTKTNNKMSTVSSRVFSSEEAGRYAGSRNDPARMAANFAGVSGANDSRNDIIIRGNSPLGVLWPPAGWHLQDCYGTARGTRPGDATLFSYRRTI